MGGMGSDGQRYDRIYRVIIVFCFRHLEDDMSLKDYKWNGFDEEVHACNCVGPQGGERLCPCMLRSENQKKQAWMNEILEKYDLVPKKKVIK